MTLKTTDHHLAWDKAAGMPPAHVGVQAPQGALVPSPDAARDHVAVVYERRLGPPEITVKNPGACVQTVLADGMPIAIIASASAPSITAADVLLVERVL
ncbi:MAG: hypothetical protein AAF307_09730 [Pseudomonadota bacterium]